MGLVGLCAWPYTVDDSFIIARYASRIASGQGYTFNPGPATDGVTGPAWLLPGILASRAGYDPVLAAKWVGLLCSILAAFCVVSEQRRRSAGWVTAPVVLLILVCQPGLGGSGVSGLETGAATLAVTLGSRAALARPAPRSLVVGGCVACLAWLRPELVFVAAVLLAACSVRAGTAARAAWVLALAGAVSVCLFRWSLTGSPVPMSFSAKAGALSDGVEYAARAVLVISGGFGLVLAGAGAYLGQSRERWRALLLLAHLVAVILAGGDWMPGFRLFVPVLPEYAQLAGVGAVRLWRGFSDGGGRRRGWPRALASISLFAACALPVFDLALRSGEWRQAGASREQVGRAIARALRDATTRVALVDIGFLGYASAREVVDLAGITDPEVAAFPGGHLNKRIDAQWLERRAPDALLLHSALPPTAADDDRLLSLHGYPVEQRVARFAWVQREFRLSAVYAYAPRYYYALLVRRGPPGAARAAREAGSGRDGRAGVEPSADSMAVFAHGFGVSTWFSGCSAHALRSELSAIGRAPRGSRP